VVIGLAYLAFTYFVPIRSQPPWVTEARLLPMVQSTAEVLLSVVPDQHRGDYDEPQHPEVVRQAPAASDNPGGHDPMADLIRRNEAGNRVPKSTKEPVQQKSAAKATKSYGASDRQALDKLVETGGNR
jgi:membrane protein required for colicin V production